MVSQVGGASGKTVGVPSARRRAGASGPLLISRGMCCFDCRRARIQSHDERRANSSPTPASPIRGHDEVDRRGAGALPALATDLGAAGLSARPLIAVEPDLRWTGPLVPALCLLLARSANRGVRPAYRARSCWGHRRRVGRVGRAATARGRRGAGDAAAVEAVAHASRSGRGARRDGEGAGVESSARSQAGGRRDSRHGAGAGTGALDAVDHHARGKHLEPASRHAVTAGRA